MWLGHKQPAPRLRVLVTGAEMQEAGADGQLITLFNIQVQVGEQELEGRRWDLPALCEPWGVGGSRKRRTRAQRARVPVLSVCCRAALVPLVPVRCGRKRGSRSP